MLQLSFDRREGEEEAKPTSSSRIQNQPVFLVPVNKTFSTQNRSGVDRLQLNNLDDNDVNEDENDEDENDDEDEDDEDEEEDET